MPLKTNLFEQFLFLQLNQAPGPILDLIGAVGFRSMVAAVRLGLFDALAAGPLAPAEIAGRLGLSERGVTVLLEFLAGLGYVRWDGSRFANTPMTARWLVRSSRSSFAPGMLFWGAILWDLWDNLEDSVRAGQPPLNMYAWIENEPEVSRDFQEWMVALARVAGGEMMDRLGPHLPAGASRVLDVGGGHGMYSVELCRRFPAITATVIDSPQALVTARQTLAAEGMAGRVLTQAADFMQADLGTGYDAVLLFNIIHGFQAADNLALLRRAAAALKPGGVVAVVEQLAGPAPGPATRAANLMFGLSYFTVLDGGIYSYDQLAGWLAEAGFKNVRRSNLLRAPGSSLVLGTKAA